MGTLQHRIADDSTIIGMHSGALFGEIYLMGRREFRCFVNTVQNEQAVVRLKYETLKTYNLRT